MELSIDKVKAEAAQIGTADLIAPDGKIESGETVVKKEVPNELKQLYTLWMRYTKDAKQAYLDAEYAQQTEQKERLAIRGRELAEKAELVKAVFWVTVKDEYDLWDKPMVGIRKGWKLVWGKSSHPLAALSALLGG